MVFLVAKRLDFGGGTGAHGGLLKDASAFHPNAPDLALTQIMPKR
jgi:hypothetical protein